MENNGCFYGLSRLLFEKEVFYEGDCRIKKYKICRFAIFKKEKTSTQKKTFIFGLPVLRKNIKNVHNLLFLKRLLNDDRIVLDLEFFYKTLEGLAIEKYEIRKIKLKDIKREWYGKKYLLEECSPYAYLKGDKERYQKYVEQNAQCSLFKMSEKRFDTLLSSLNQNGFDERNMPVINATNNVIMDGQHRCCWLLEKYGGDFEVNALFLYPARKKS